MYNKKELLENFQKLRVVFDHSKKSIRFSVLIIGLFIVFYGWKMYLGINLNDRKTLRNYEISNQQLIKKVERFEQDIKSGKLVKINNDKVSNRNDYNSTEKVLKYVNQIIRSIDEFQVQQAIVMDYGDHINGVQIKIKGGYFPLLSFVKSIIEDDLPIEISKLKYEIVNYPEANIDIYLKIKEIKE